MFAVQKTGWMGPGLAKTDLEFVYMSYFILYFLSPSGEEYITRDCLDTLMRSTPHRKAMPTVRRHGYCLPSRMNLADPSAPHTRYCFCNDFNGCNSGTGIKARLGVVLSLAVVSTVLLKFL